MTKNSLIKFVTTIFGLGYSPVFPGTLAGFLAFLTYLVIIPYGFPVHFTLTILVTCLGFCFCGLAEKIFKQKDARPIVIDDYAGVLTGLLFLPYSFKMGVAGFLVFRIMDGLKPYPIYKIEEMPGGKAVMLDDIAAGIYTNIVLQIAFKLISANFYKF